MKPSKLSLVVFALIFSSVTFATPNAKINDLKELSLEVELLLRDSNHGIEAGTSATLFFSISEDKKIQYISVASLESEVAELLQKKLLDQELDGETWKEGKIYELSIGHGDVPKPCEHI